MCRQKRGRLHQSLKLFPFLQRRSQKKLFSPAIKATQKSETPIKASNPTNVSTVNNKELVKDKDNENNKRQSVLLMRPGGPKRTLPSSIKSQYIIEFEQETEEKENETQESNENIKSEVTPQPKPMANNDSKSKLFDKTSVSDPVKSKPALPEEKKVLNEQTSINSVKNVSKENVKNEKIVNNSNQKTIFSQNTKSDITKNGKQEEEMVTIKLSVLTKMISDLENGSKLLETLTKNVKDCMAKI